jgi:hypothetical protein
VRYELIALGAQRGGLRLVTGCRDLVSVHQDPRNDFGAVHDSGEARHAASTCVPSGRRVAIAIAPNRSTREINSGSSPKPGGMGRRVTQM